MSENFEIMPKKSMGAFLSFFLQIIKMPKIGSKSRTIHILSNIMRSTDSKNPLKQGREIFKLK